MDSSAINSLVNIAAAFLYVLAALVPIIDRLVKSTSPLSRTRALNATLRVLFSCLPLIGLVLVFAFERYAIAQLFFVAGWQTSSCFSGRPGHRRVATSFDSSTTLPLPSY